MGVFDRASGHSGCPVMGRPIQPRLLPQFRPPSSTNPRAQLGAYPPAEPGPAGLERKDRGRWTTLHPMCLPNTSRLLFPVSTPWYRRSLTLLVSYRREPTLIGRRRPPLTLWSTNGPTRTSILQDSCLMDRALPQAFQVLVRDPAGHLRLPSSPQLASPLTREVCRRLSAKLQTATLPLYLSLSYDQGPAYPTSNPVIATSYTSNGTQFGPSSTPAYAQSPTSMGYRTGGRHRRSRSLSVSPTSSDETINVGKSQNSTSAPRAVEPSTSNAWLTSQVSGDLVPLVARAAQLASQERQGQQLGIPPSQRSVDPNCPFKQITLDPGASIIVDGCRVVNQGRARQTYWIYSQDDLRAPLGLPRVEVVDERQGRKTDKERRRRRERSRSRKGVY
ncbi:hypothetical protein FA13DRAFT_938972 [Coprinellus micaceus]|uniref:Uncharacterized protein n=1 Tax=Coprinellus micaceus TaxID=71717 RepID=A0A4Y7S0M0_COPMI|nr:hypothetical protein FA13DRAFT_938972 [Coprinellus micaceus]